MGIPFYFASLIKAHKNVVSRLRAKLQPSILAVDFNCLIHNYMDDARPVESVVEALIKILDETCQPQLLYIAMDGLVPYAKIVQQRYRRFRISEAGVFDRNQISPGTPYMKELDQKVPDNGYRKFKVMGKEFDAAQPEKYIDSFAIRRT
jgi:5'-3' exonuclease